MASWALASPSWALAAAMAPPAATFRSIPMALSGLVWPFAAFSTRPMAVCRSRCFAAAMFAARPMSFMIGAALPCEVSRLPTASSVWAFVYPNFSICDEVASICGLRASNDVPAALAEATIETWASSYLAAMSTAAMPTASAPLAILAAAIPETLPACSKELPPPLATLCMAPSASPSLAMNSEVFNRSRAATSASAITCTSAGSWPGRLRGSWP